MIKPRRLVLMTIAERCACPLRKLARFLTPLPHWLEIQIARASTKSPDAGEALIAEPLRRRSPPADRPGLDRSRRHLRGALRKLWP